MDDMLITRNLLFCSDITVLLGAGVEQSVWCRCAIYTAVQYRTACSALCKSGATGCRTYVPNFFPEIGDYRLKV